MTTTKNKTIAASSLKEALRKRDERLRESYTTEKSTDYCKDRLYALPLLPAITGIRRTSRKECAACIKERRKWISLPSILEKLPKVKDDKRKSNRCKRLPSIGNQDKR